MTARKLIVTSLATLTVVACANSPRTVEVRDAVDSGGCIYADLFYSVGARKQSEKVVIRETSNSAAAQERGGIWMTCTKNSGGEFVWISETAATN
jgi:hypothetical protein